MRDLVCACTVARTGSALLVDPTAEEAGNADALALVAMQPQLNRVAKAR